MNPQEAVEMLTEVLGPNAKNALEGDEIPKGLETLSDMIDEHVREGIKTETAPPGPDELEVELRKSMEEGRFDLRGRVGRLWTKCLKLDDALKEAYHEAGKNYEKQRAVREKWNRAMYEKEMNKRRKIDSNTSKDTKSGSYKSLAFIANAQGGDKPAAVAARNYCVACVKLFNAGKLCNGRQWLKYNHMTLRTDFLYVEEGFEDSASQAWELIKTERERRECAQAEEKLSGAEQRPGAGGSVPPGSEKRKQEPKPAAKGKAAPQPKAKATPRPAEQDLKKVRSVKQTMDQVMSSAMTVLENVASEPEWAWANSPAILADIRGALHSVKKARVASPFWKDVSASDPATVGVMLKGKYDATKISDEMRECGALETKLDALKKAADVIKGMHKARSL